MKTEDLLALVNSGFLREKEMDMWRAAVGNPYCRMDLPGPTTSVGTRIDYSWAPGTTRLALHGT
jgi:hypothetical protein